ncbi:MAG: SDR family oxidoreductase [Desulfobacterales bacterium]|nr:SDR family oxidoreductase [Desulfobacterales bacterium]
MKISMENKKVLITAGGSGICRVVADMFLAEGATVHICDVDPAAVKDFSGSHPKAGGTVCDVSDPGQVENLFEAADRHLKGLDILINGAGIGGSIGTVDEIDTEGWRRTVEVNLNGTFHCARLAVPRIKARGCGSIINFSSTAGFLAYAMRSPYAAAKWGLIGFTKTLALEQGRYGIRVNAVCPGVVEGERMDRVIAGEAAAKGISEAQVRENYTRGNALRTFVSPEDIGSTILFLCSDYGNKITGQAIAVDGFTESNE